MEDYKQPYNTKPGEGKRGHHSTPRTTRRNPGQKTVGSIPHNYSPGPGSPVPMFPRPPTRKPN